jgi:nucleoside-diphosphate-sugar epimerase
MSKQNLFRPLVSRGNEALIELAVGAADGVSLPRRLRKRNCLFVPLRLTRGMRALIVGCGYVGFPLGAELMKLGHEVFGLRRSAAADVNLKAAGITPLHADITQPETLAALPTGFEWVVNCAASGGGDVDAYRRHYLEGTRNLIAWLAGSPPAKFVYTSSTGVYGQNDGSLVRETSPTEPATETARVLVETEKVLLTAAREKNFPAVILRVAGIYGPERGHLLKQYLRNEARIEGNGGRILNMIHRDDLIGVSIAALKSGWPGEVYNAVDDEPVTQRSFFEWLAETLGKDLPPNLPENADTYRKRGASNKWVSNQKLKQELDYRFKYPHFRSGYTAEIMRLKSQGFPS